MNKIERLIKELCPNGVEWEEIGKIIDYEQPTKYLVSSKEYNDNYELPVLTAGQTFILGYTNETEGIYQASKENPVIIFDDFTTSKKWVDFNFKVKSTAMKILKVKSGVSNILIRYVWHYLGTITYSPDQHGRQWISTYSKFKIPIPPLEIQEEIVKILDKFTDYVTELTTELTLRQKQYNYYRDKLFTFEGEKVEWKRLEEVCEIFLGVTYTPSYTKDGVKFISAQNISKDYLDLNNIKYISYEEYQNITRNAKPQRGDVLFARVGSNTGHPVVLESDEEFCIFVSIGYLRPKEEIVRSYFLKHWMNSELFWKQVENKVYGSAKINLNTGWLKNFLIPIPFVAKQDEIINKLNQFETLNSSLSSGLPKEIELRQKQYEYYRDKLLTFD